MGIYIHIYKYVCIYIYTHTNVLFLDLPMGNLTIVTNKDFSPLHLLLIFYVEDKN